MNLYQQFSALLPKSPVTLCTVVAAHAGGTVTVSTQGGVQIRVYGEGVSPGEYVQVQAGRIINKIDGLVADSVQVV